MLKHCNNWQEFISLQKIVIILIIIGIIFIGKAGLREIRKKTELDEELVNLSSQIQAFEKKNQEISRLIENFSKKSYLETEARKRLNLRKSGEKVVVILPPENEIGIKSEEKSELEKIWEWIQDKILNPKS